MGVDNISAVLPSASLRVRRWIGIWLLILLLAAGSIFVPVIRRPILQAAGWALVADDPLQPAEIIVLSVGSDGAEFLEAADLVHQGIANKVAVFEDIDNPMLVRELRRRGLPYEDSAQRALRELRELGVENIEQIPQAVSGTTDEGAVLANWCDQNRFPAVIVVSPPDHSRRLRRILHRTMKGHATKVSVRYSRYLEFDPDRWWQKGESRKTELEELEKLLLDVGRHPIS